MQQYLPRAITMIGHPRLSIRSTIHSRRFYFCFILLSDELKVLCSILTSDFVVEIFPEQVV